MTKREKLVDLSSFLVQILNGINSILIIILVALGLVIIYGLMRVINMAHCEFFTLGAYTVFVTQWAGLGFWVGLLSATVVVGLIGMAIEFFVVRFLYQRPLDTILATWGLSIAIRQFIIVIFGPRGEVIVLPVTATLTFAGIEYPLYRLFIMTASIVLIAGTFYVFLKTDYGLQARAVIENKDIAEALGINARRMYRDTFTFGAALAGIAGAIMCPLISVDPQMGMGYLIPAFLSIIIGGEGTLHALLVGGSVIGGGDSIFSYLISPTWAQVFVFSIAIVIIRFKPKGILGKYS